MYKKCAKTLNFSHHHFILFEYDYVTFTPKDDDDGAPIPIVGIQIL